MTARVTVAGRVVGWVVVAVLVAGCSGGSPAKPDTRHRSKASAAAADGRCAHGYRRPQPTPHYPPPPRTPLPRRLDRRLDAALAAGLAGASRDAGITAAVVTEHGVWTGAAGRALDGSRLQPASPMAIGSVTKTITAAEVMHLVEADRVDLRRRISSYVALPVHDNGATVQDLLTMRSGIRDYVDQPLFDRIDRAPHQRITVEESLDLVPKEVDKAGAFFEYSNTNYLLLGQLIEKVTGTTYARAVHRDLLDPAGFADMTVQDEESAPGVPGPDPYLPNRAFASTAWAAGSVVTDARSTALWGYRLWGGLLPGADCLAQMPARGTAQYGIATDTLRAAASNLELLGHGGQIGPYNSVLVAVRGHPVAVAVLTLAEDGIDPMPTMNALLERIVPHP